MGSDSSGSMDQITADEKLKYGKIFSFQRLEPTTMVATMGRLIMDNHSYVTTKKPEFIDILEKICH